MGARNENTVRNDSAADLFGRMKRLLAAFFPAAYVVLFCCLGKYAFPSADDYSFVNMLADKGFWLAQREWYTSWTGRFANTFMVSLVSLCDLNRVYPWLPWLNAFFNIAVFGAFLNAICRQWPWQRKLRWALTFQAVWFAFLPQLNETFYWLSGMPYTWAITVSIWGVVLSADVFRKRKLGLTFGLLCLVVFWNAAILEPTSVVQTAVLFFLTVYFFYRRRHFFAFQAGILLAIAFAGFCIVYFSPGTVARMSAISSGSLKNPIRTLGVACVFGGITVLKFFRSPFVYVWLLFLPELAEKVVPFDRKLSLHLRPWHIVLCVASVAPFLQAVAGWATGAGLPARAEALAVAVMAFFWVFLWGWGYRGASFLEKIRRSVFFRWRYIFLGVCLILNANFFSLLNDMRTAPLYAREMETRYLLVDKAKSKGMPDVVVPALEAKPGLLYFSDLSFSENDWKNQSFSRYWRINSVRALPLRLMRSSVRKNGDFDALVGMGDEGDAHVQFVLGEIYDPTFAIADGVLKDEKTAFSWYSKAASQGHRHAQRRLVRMYASGAGTPRNYLKAVGWLLRAEFF